MRPEVLNLAAEVMAEGMVSWDVYSPDLNPIEMAFAKLKALIRRAAARTYDDLWRTLGRKRDGDPLLPFLT